MSEIPLEHGDLEFLRTLPRLATRHPANDVTDATVVAENARIRRLQRHGLMRCVIDAEESDGTFILAELSLTDAGRAVLAADK